MRNEPRGQLQLPASQMSNAQRRTQAPPLILRPKVRLDMWCSEKETKPSIYYAVRSMPLKCLIKAEDVRKASMSRRPRTS
jgi:hypothetical protein